MKKRLNGMILVLLMTISTLLLSTGCPGDVKGPPKIIKVSAGGYHTVLLKDNGTVWVTGRNNKGQLGLPGTYSQYSFKQVPNLSGIVDISAGWEHTVAVKNDGTVWGTGETFSGQLGLGADQNPRFEFMRVPDLTDVVAVSAGDMHTIALKRDGTVWGTGENKYGELGLGTTGKQTTFTQLPNISNASGVVTGLGFSIVILNDGRVYAAGWNDEGQLGLGDKNDRHTFTAVPNVTGIKSGAAGASHTVLLKNNGEVLSTGSNKYGQLGIVASGR